jgi:ubiquinone/menaquinone biosynthesis C-methylase UbiE
MLLTDGEIIKNLKIEPTDRVLDIGGSMMQHGEIEIDTLADIIRPEQAPYGASKLLAKKFIKADLTRGVLPFKDKEFDVCLCTHVLEDLPTPFPIMDEMSRVAKRGLIVTPSMGKDMEFGPIDFTDWLTGARRVPGEAHHKWFFVKIGDHLKVIPKNYPILYTKEFQIVRWTGEKEMEYYWQVKINYSEFSGLNIHKLIDEYKSYTDKNEKNIKIGTAVVFLDNPFNFAKAFAKKLLKRGPGYKYRNEKTH